MKIHTTVAARWRVLLTAAAVTLLGVFTAACGTGPGTTTGNTTPPPTAFHALVVAASIKTAPSATFTTRLAAFDPSTGRQIWSQSLPGYPGGERPALASGAVVESIGIAGTSYPSSQVAAFNVRTGAPLWQRGFGTNTQAHAFAAGGTLILTTSAVSADAPNALRGLTVTALRPGDGSQTWQHTVPGVELVAPVLNSDGTVFVIVGQASAPAMSYWLMAYDAISGAQRWEKALGTGTLVGTAAGDGGIYVSLIPGHLPAAVSPATSGMALLDLPLVSPTVGAMTAYRTSDGAQLWQVSGFVAAQTEIGGTLYATSATQQPTGSAAFAVTAFNAATGGQLWQSSQSEPGDIIESKPFVAADTQAAYAFNMPEKAPCVYALDGASGAKRWEALPNSTFDTGLAGLSKVFVAALPARPVGQPPQAANAALYGLNATTGAQLWRVEVDSSVHVALTLV
jgi:outer membrane protein assembly factor BamB